MSQKPSLNLSRSIFTKASGARNDFIIVDVRESEKYEIFEEDFAGETREQLAIRLCDRYDGLGADGLIFLENTPVGGLDFAWDFYNSDGSKAEMCGNAARCVALYARSHGIAKSRMKFMTLAGEVSVEFLPDQRIAVTMPQLDVKKWGMILKFSEKVRELDLVPYVEIDWLNSGVPHAVILVDSLKPRRKLKRIARIVRSHLDLGPDGANVTFYRPMTGEAIASMTFERGVEDFTQACGTGAVAAAYAFAHTQKQDEIEVEVFVPGGVLLVKVQKARPVLVGEARLIGESRVQRFSK